MEAVLKNFECPVCMEYFQKPIYQCVTGHSFCTNCKAKLEKCPSCLQPFSNTRNYAIECVMTTITVACKHDLCTKRIPLHSYVQHTNECPFGNIKCKHPDCTWNDNRLLINDHIKIVHSSLVIQKFKKIESHQFTVSFIEHGGNMYCIKRYIDDNHMVWTGEPTSAISTRKLFLVIKIITATGTHTLKQPIVAYLDKSEVARANSIACALKNKTKGSVFQFSIEDDN